MLVRDGCLRTLVYDRLLMIVTVYAIRLMMPRHLI